MAFITSLKIKNFFSIKDEVTLDFKASPYNIENNPERLFEFNGEYYNKIISLYGANASGKTTILKAITTLANTVSNQSSEEFDISFKNKFNSENDITKLSITFVIDIENKLREFFYEIEFKSNGYESIGINNETLAELIKNKKNILIERRSKNVSNIADNITKAIFDNLSNKKSLIEEFYKFEEIVLGKVYHFFFFLSGTSNINSHKKHQTQLSTDFLDKKAIAVMLNSIENFFIKFFNSIGIDIVKLEAKYKEVNGKPKELINIYVFHKLNPTEPLEFDLESDGTQMLMKILLIIYSANYMKQLLVLDELDSSIHPSLVPIIINLLIENDIQIIYSTHNIYNMQFLQNDEIFLIEKDSNHKTTIKPVKHNPDIKDYKNLLTLYENGYLGGLPNIKEIITKIL